MGAAPRARTSALLDLWVGVLAALLCLPALTQRGLGLSGDLVFSPRQPLTLETVGLGGRLPRAVPLDAVLGLLGYVAPGAVLFRVAVLAGLVLAGCGAHRLARGSSVPARVVAATFAMWNPYVVERLALGQWALILGYGALFFVACSALRSNAGQPPWSVWAWVGLASLTPTGGLLASAVGVALAGRDRARPVVVALGCAVLQLPWVLPSLIGGGVGVGDPTGVVAFRAQPDAPGGIVVSLLGLGGIWDLDSVPTSRGSVLGVAAAAVVVAALLGARRRLPPGAGRLWPVALVGVALAVAPWVPGLSDAVRLTIEHVPGGGLLRDSQKWLAPLVVLATISLAVSLDRLGAWVERRASGVGVVVVCVGLATPFVLLPDAASTTWDAVRPVRYPADFAAVRDRLDSGSGAETGSMVLLPWRAYRTFDWGNPRAAHDPAYAWFDVAMVGSSALVVGRRSVSDRDATAEKVRRAAEGPDAGARLARLGVRWALVYTDDPGTPDLRLEGLDRVAGGHDLRLYRVAGHVADDPGIDLWRRLLVIGLDLLVLCAWLGCCVLGVRQRFAAKVHPVDGRIT